MSNILAVIRERRKRLQQELELLEQLERMYRDSPSSTEVQIETNESIAHASTEKTHHYRRARSRSGTRTIKDMILEILQRGPSEGYTANEILDNIKSEYGVAYARTSLSPQLSRLRDEGKILSRRPRWCLKDSGRGEDVLTAPEDAG